VCLPAEDAAAVRAAGDPASTFERVLAHASADLSSRLVGARRTSPERSATGLPNQARRPFGDGWVLVGDAGYHRDPITGHGITDAFRDAELAADAIDAALTGTEEVAALRAYETERDDLSRSIFDLTCRLGRFPHPTTFVELQRQLSQAIDIEASTLAARARPVAAAA
jgi:flavin-dependent dehydrogenase